MHALRQRLPRFAALVLLVWLFATGVAFAHTCQSTMDLDCIECCDEVTDGSGWTASRTETVVPAQAADAFPVVAPAPQPAWQPTAEAALPSRDPPDRAVARLIPIVFLRLAL